MGSSGAKNLSRHSHHQRLLSSPWRIVLALACAAFFGNGAWSQPKEADTTAIRALLDRQVEAWNRGDIDAFMKTYWYSDSTLFISGGTLTRGYREVLSRYKKSYDNKEKMGQLEFRDLNIEPLSQTIAVATGIWELKRQSDNPWGRFTLILEMKAEGWRIVHDHTSSAGR